MNVLLGPILGAVGNFFGKVFELLFISHQAKEAATAEQVLSTEQQANAKVEAAVEARDTVKPILNDDELRQHTPENDPDFRD